MKNVIIAVVLIFGFIIVNAQDCKVLVPELSGTYEGECKKNLANGEGLAKGKDTYKGMFKKGYPNGLGVYTYSNGDVFEGIFQKGEKHGEGVMLLKRDQLPDSVLRGFWSKNTYQGKFKVSFEENNRSNGVTSVNVNRNNIETFSIIHVKFLRQGSPMGTPQFDIAVIEGEFGDRQVDGATTKIWVNKFPFRFRITVDQHIVEYTFNNAASYDMVINLQKEEF